MAEAGLMLSVVSLTFQVFSGCVQGYQLLTDAKHMPSDSQYLRVRLKTEQYRLLDWGHVVHLDEQDDNLLISNTSKGLLLDILDQKNKLLQQYGRLDEKYKMLRKPLLVDDEEARGDLPSPPPYSPESPTSASLARVDTEFQDRFPQSEALLRKSLEWAKKTKQYPRRLKWATFDKAKIEALIIRLSGFNDYMREMLNASQLQTLAIKQTRTEFQIMQLNGRIDQLVQIFESAALNTSGRQHRNRIPTDNVRAFLQAGSFEATEEDASSDKPALKNLASLAQIKALNSAIEDSTLLTDEFTNVLDLGQTASEIQSVELSRRSIAIHEEEPDETGESPRVEATYTHPVQGSTKTVWIEWKTYDPIPSMHPPAPNPKIQARVKALAALLKDHKRTSQFRAPHCLGYFRDIDDQQGEDHCRFGLVFEKPPNVHQDTRPISLLSLLQDKNFTMPSLTSRIALSKRIAECIERLHAVNWLHKGLRSSNILFFPKPRDPSSPPSTKSASTRQIDLSQPYISGFDYSRPATHEDLTEKPPENATSDIYRHPRVQWSANHNSFKKSYDIYALGVILLEIAYWQPIHRILGIKDLPNARPSVTIKVRQRLLEEEYLEYVKSYLGDTVEGVVKACLVGVEAFGLGEDDDERSGEGGAKLQEGFYEKVVGELGGMRV